MFKRFQYACVCFCCLCITNPATGLLDLMKGNNIMPTTDKLIGVQLKDAHQAMREPFQKMSIVPAAGNIVDPGAANSTNALCCHA